MLKTVFVRQLPENKVEPVAGNSSSRERTICIVNLIWIHKSFLGKKKKNPSWPFRFLYTVWEHPRATTQAASQRLSFLCAKDLKVYLGIPAVKCCSYSSKLSLAKCRGLIIWQWLMEKFMIAICSYFTMPFTTMVILLTASCCTFHPDPLRVWGITVVPAISQMFVQCCPLWLIWNHSKVLFCSLNLLLWKPLLWPHTYHSDRINVLYLPHFYLIGCLSKVNKH